jgi:glycosyltransferase involved in cell wall biosynthesis
VKAVYGAPARMSPPSPSPKHPDEIALAAPAALTASPSPARALAAVSTHGDAREGADGAPRLPRKRPYVSIVVPIFNEVDNIAPLVDELLRALTPLGQPFEILAVDDGSTDGSFGALERAHQAHPEVVAIELRRNFGQTAAFAAGFDRARGTWIVTIDADLQNDPADIGKLLDKAEEGFDVVSGWRIRRKDALLSRKLPSRAANWLIGRVTGVGLHDYGCSLKVYHREVIKQIRIYGELHRFVPAVASGIGIRVAEVPVNHRARTRGESKYGGPVKTVMRTVKVFLDLLTVRFLLSYSTRPIHVFGVLGLLSGLLGLGMGSYLTYEKLVHGESLRDRPLLMLAVLLVMVGVQFVTMGLLGEIVMRVYHEAQHKPIYAVRKVLDAGRARKTARRPRAA